MRSACAAAVAGTFGGTPSAVVPAVSDEGRRAHEPLRGVGERPTRLVPRDGKHFFDIIIIMFAEGRPGYQQLNDLTGYTGETLACAPPRQRLIGPESQPSSGLQWANLVENGSEAVAFHLEIIAALQVQPEAL
jgi:hypothetical protein